MKNSLLLFLALTLGACHQTTWDDDPESLYDRGRDTDALQAAKHWLDTKYDVAVRLFIVRYNLARYLETGERRYADEIARYYQGADKLDWKSIRWNLNHDEFQQEARYFDAAIALFVKHDRQAALTLLDSYCPQAAVHLEKIKCHVKNYGYFESQARDGYDRNWQEIAFLADLTVGIAYQDYKMIGHALELQAGYDIQHASERARAYAERNENNDEVMRRFCAVPAKYFKYGPDTRNYAAYIAAYERANCKLYLAPEPSGKAEMAQ